jgi:hypothetical protein
MLEYLSRALIARGAPHDLDEAFRIATRSGMRLHLVDCHLASTRIALAEGDSTQARKHLENAATLVEDTGYHRRDPDLNQLRAQLAV